MVHLEATKMPFMGVCVWGELLQGNSVRQAIDYVDIKQILGHLWEGRMRIKGGDV